MIQAIRDWNRQRRRVRKVARARAEFSTFNDQIRRLGDCYGFLVGVSDLEAHHRLVFLLTHAANRVEATAVAFEIYGREAIQVLAEAMQQPCKPRS